MFGPALLSYIALLSTCLYPISAVPVDDAIRSAVAARGVDTRSEARQLNSQIIGPSHGEFWSDEAMIRDGRHHRLQTIKLYCGERVDGIQFAFADLQPDNGKIVTKWTTIHGRASGSKVVTIPLGFRDYVTGISVVVVKESRGWLNTARSRIGYIEIKTALGKNTFGCGEQANGGGTQTFDVDYTKYTLLYMSGHAGDEVDSLQGHFIPIADYAR